MDGGQRQAKYSSSPSAPLWKSSLGSSDPCGHATLVGIAVPRPWSASSLTVNAKRVPRRDRFMASSPSSAYLLEHAIHAMIRRWRLLPQAASTALMETAEELGVEIGDLAALVLASERHQRAQHPSRTRGGPDGVQKRALFVVGDETAAALRPKWAGTLRGHDELGDEGSPTSRILVSVAPIKTGWGLRAGGA